MHAEYLKQCAVVVAGGGRGIGRACSILLAAHGADVLVLDPGVEQDGTVVTNDAVAADVAAEIIRAGGRAVGVADSVGSFADGDRIITRCLDEFGRLDAVLAPAAVLRDRMVFNMTEEDWRIVLDVNLSGVFGLVRAACRVMRAQRRGRIVTFTSVAGLEGRAGTSNYAAAKMGVVGLTKAVALDMKKYDVRVNCISPRADTRLTRRVAATRPATRPLGISSAWAGNTLGAPEDIAPLAVYLASGRCQATGRVFYSAGGEVGVYPDFLPIRIAHVNETLDVDATATVIESRLLHDGAASEP